MKWNRRQFMMAGLAGPTLVAQQHQPTPVLDRGFGRVTELAPGLYVTIADPSHGPQCTSNGGVIAGRESVLIVEGHMEPAGAALEIEAARTVSKAPIRGAVDTHFHLDHTFGNLAFAQQHIPILAHEKVKPLMQEQYAARKATDKSSLLAPLEKKLVEAANDTEKKRREEDLATWKWMYDAIDHATLAFPTESLRSAQLPKRIDLGGISAIIEFHPGHTPTDVIVRVPQRDVVFAGDLLFNNAYPVSLDADMIAWRSVLELFSDYGRRTRFVPGHGPVCGVDTVRDQCALFDDLRAHAEKMLRAGVAVDEAERRYLVPKQFQNHSIHSWDFTIGAAMRSYFAKLPQSAG